MVTGGLEILGHLDWHGQQDLAFVAEIGKRADADFLWHRPLNLARLQARRQIPVQLC